VALAESDGQVDPPGRRPPVGVSTLKFPQLRAPPMAVGAAAPAFAQRFCFRIVPSAAPWRKPSAAWCGELRIQRQAIPRFSRGFFLQLKTPDIASHPDKNFSISED
jgi:hypothetical protein